MSLKIGLLNSCLYTSRLSPSSQCVCTHQSLSINHSTGIGISHCNTGLPSMIVFFNGSMNNGEYANVELPVPHSPPYTGLAYFPVIPRIITCMWNPSQKACSKRVPYQRSVLGLSFPIGRPESPIVSPICAMFCQICITVLYLKPADPSAPMADPFQGRSRISVTS